ncbi:MAG TPA: hypothetical protein VKE74_31315 [Gemmataceae bacterium]|nr:hypothetical protein [Gemmataceae bacterium]
MAVPTLITAVLLIVVGVVGYVGQVPEPGKEKSLTALIPAMVGGVLAVCGLLAFSGKLRKHAMHFAAIVGLLGFVGGFMPLQRQAAGIKKAADEAGSPISTSEAWSRIDPLKPSAVSGELMSLICLVFVGLCVNSFIQARKARAAREAAGQPTG